MKKIFATCLLFSVISFSAFADSCFTSAYSATRTGGTSNVLNSHETAIEVAVSVCSNQINLDDYLATRAGGYSNILNSHQDALEVAQAVQAGEIRLADYMATRTGGTSGMLNSHAQAMLVARQFCQ